MKKIVLIIFLVVTGFGKVVGQNDTSSVHVNSSEEPNQYHFGIGLGLIYNSQPQLLFSPIFQLHSSKYISFYVGPSFIIPLEQIQLKNKASFRLGIKYSFLAKKITPFIRWEFSRINYEYNSVLYDYAFPNIPIKATVLNIHRSTGLNLNLGINYRITKRLYISGEAGGKLLWERNYEPSQAANYKKNYTKTSLKFSQAFTFSIETGIYF